MVTLSQIDVITGEEIARTQFLNHDENIGKALINMGLGPLYHEYFIGYEVLREAIKRVDALLHFYDSYGVKFNPHGKYYSIWGRISFRYGDYVLTVEDLYSIPAADINGYLNLKLNRTYPTTINSHCSRCKFYSLRGHCCSFRQHLRPELAVVDPDYTYCDLYFDSRPTLENDE